MKRGELDPSWLHRLVPTLFIDDCYRRICSCCDKEGARENCGFDSQRDHRTARKRFYRARAHSNPLSDSQFPVSLCHGQFDYSQHYPLLYLASPDHGCTRQIQFADIGCRFGGLLDPHFKEKNHRRRVISPHLLDEYAYTLADGGGLYTITDVEELGEWMESCLDEHPMFEAVSKEEVEADPVVNLLTSATE